MIPFDKNTPGTHRYEVVDPAAGGQLPDDLDGLMRRLADTNALRRGAARDALVKKGAKAVEPLTRALKDARPHVRVAAAQALARIDLPVARAALEPLLRADEPLLARLAAQALASSPSAGTLPAWAALLGSDDFVLRAAAAEALGRLKKAKSVDLLLARLDDPRSEVRCKVIWALGELAHPKALAPLYDRLVNERGAAADGMSARERYFAKKKPQPIYRDLSEHKGDFDALAAALVKLGEPAIAKLILATVERLGPARHKAIAALVRIGRPAVPHLITAAKAGRHGVSAGAVKVLARLRPPEAIEALLAATDNPRDQYAADKAFEALIAYGAAAKDKLKPAVHSAHLRLMARASAAALLVPLGDRSGQYVLESVIGTGERVDMNRLVSRMGKLRHPAFLPLIAKALERPDASQTVAYAAAYCGGAKAIPLLKKALTHPNRGVRSGAKMWLGRLRKEEHTPPLPR